MTKALIMAARDVSALARAALAVLVIALSPALALAQNLQYQCRNDNFTAIIDLDISQKQVILAFNEGGKVGKRYPAAISIGQQRGRNGMINVYSWSITFDHALSDNFNLYDSGETQDSKEIEIIGFINGRQDRTQSLYCNRTDTANMQAENQEKSDRKQQALEGDLADLRAQSQIRIAAAPKYKGDAKLLRIAIRNDAPTLVISSKADDIVIFDVVVNRGNCLIDRDDARSFPVQLGFGDVTNWDPKGKRYFLSNHLIRCPNISEITVYTDHGYMTYSIN